jgi:hypothetical protein
MSTINIECVGGCDFSTDSKKEISGEAKGKL